MSDRIYRPRTGAPAPYGYYRDPEDPKYCDENDDETAALAVVIEFVEIKSMTIKDASKYLTQITDRYISPEGLRKLIRKRTHPIFDIIDA